MADPNKEPVQAVPFDFTKYTGIGAATATATVALYAGLKTLIDEAPDPIIGLGILLAAGLFGLALAISAGADVLARSYVTSNTTADPKDATKAVPASIVLAEAMTKQSEEARVLAMPRMKGVKVKGVPATLLALRITGDKTEFHVMRDSDDEPKWVDPVAVEFPR